MGAGLFDSQLNNPKKLLVLYVAIIYCVILIFFISIFFLRIFIRWKEDVSFRGFLFEISLLLESIF